MIKPSVSPGTTPMCDVARGIHNFNLRLSHYRACKDPRCQARNLAANDIAVKLCKGIIKRCYGVDAKVVGED